MTTEEKLDALITDFCDLKKYIRRPTTGPLGTSNWLRFIVGIVGALAATGIGALIAFAIGNTSRLAVVEKTTAPVERVVAVETKVDGLEKRFDGLDTKMDKANAVLNGMAQRFQIKVESSSE